MFWIGLLDEPLRDAEPNENGRVGLLRLGDFEERFVSHLWTWSERDYVSHWRQALQRSLAGKPAALITDMKTPEQSSHLVWWPMWRVAEELVFHNQLLFFADYGLKAAQFDAERIFRLIGDRRRRNRDGQPISDGVRRPRP